MSAIPTYIVAALIAVGAFIGFSKGSTASLIAGGTSAAVLVFGATKIPTRNGYLIVTVASLVLALFMGYRYTNSLKFMPAGLVTVLSALLAVYNGSQLA